MTEATLPPYRVRIAAALEAAGPAGMLAPDIAMALGVSDSSLWEVLWRMSKRDGVVAWWPDPYGKAGNRRRYWLAAMRPAVAPAPSGPSLRDRRAAQVVGTPVQREDGVLVLPHAPVYSRHQLADLPPGFQSPLSPAECRPWAACVGRGA
jgi:hypothetical protein